MRAIYQEQKLPEHRGNPFIEALPPIPDREDLLRQLWRPIAFSPEERKLPTEYRIMLVDRLNELVLPFSNWPTYYYTFVRMIRRTYRRWTPFDPKTRQFLHYVAMRDKDGVERPNIALECADLFMGLSGQGKTTLIKRLIASHPQKIFHNEYEGVLIQQNQAVSMMIDCPCDGSLRQLCYRFFRGLDEMFGTDYFETYSKSRKTLEELLIEMEKLAALYNLGLLFVDEIQHLSKMPVNGPRMLNFFVNFVNTLGISLILVGTYKAGQMFEGNMKIIRRLSNGFPELQRPTPQDPDAWEDWDMLLEQIWRFQWIRNPGPLLPEIKESIYDITQGVTDVVVKLMILAQLEAMDQAQGDDKKETISRELLYKVFEKRLGLLEDPLRVLRNSQNDPAALAKYEDLLPPKERINQQISNRASSSDRERLRKILQKIHEEESVRDKEILSEIMKKHGIDQDKAEAIFRDLYCQEPSVAKEETKQSSKPLPKVQVPEGKSAYEEMQKAGMIPDEVYDYQK